MASHAHHPVAELKATDLQDGGPRQRGIRRRQDAHGRHVLQVHGLGLSARPEWYQGLLQGPDGLLRGNLSLLLHHGPPRQRKPLQPPLHLVELPVPVLRRGVWKEVVTVVVLLVLLGHRLKDPWELELVLLKDLQGIRAVLVEHVVLSAHDLAVVRDVCPLAPRLEGEPEAHVLALGVLSVDHRGHHSQDSCGAPDLLAGGHVCEVAHRGVVHRPAAHPHVLHLRVRVGQDLDGELGLLARGLVPP